MRRAPDSRLEVQLATLRERVILMGRMVEEMLAGAIQAVVHRDSEQAQRTIVRDDAVDRLEKESDELGLQILSRWHPRTNELRFVTAAFKAVTEIERVGDMAVNVCRRALELNASASPAFQFDVQRLGNVALGMIHAAIDALAEGDAQRAREVIEQDDLLDRYYREFSEAIVVCMQADRKAIPVATCMQIIAKDMERIGDHATNVAELVVFMVQGEDIRHVLQHPA